MDRIQRKQIKQDEFVDGTMKAFSWMEENIQPLLIAAAVVIGVVVAGWGIRSYLHYRADQGAAELAKGMAAFTAPVVKGQATRPSDPFTPTFSTPAERGKAAAERLAKAAGRSGEAGKVARYLHGIALLEAGDTAGALAELKKAHQELKDDPTLRPVAKAALAGALDQAGQRDEAINLWKQLTQGDSGYPRDLALEGLARSLENAGRKAEALQTYRELVALFPNSPAQPAAKEAQERLK